MVGLCLWKVLVMVHRCVCEGEEANKVGLFSGKELIKNYLFIFGRKKNLNKVKKYILKMPSVY